MPVTRDGKVIGIVSRANLLLALAAKREKHLEAPSGDGRTIRQALMRVLEGEHWSDSSHLNVVVLDGVVHFWVLVHSKTQAQALKVAAEDVPGVKGVVDQTYIGVKLISAV